MDVEMDIIDSQKNNNFINYHSEESSIHQIKKRNEFYGDLIYLNESTNETKVKYLPNFCKSSTNLNEDNELGNVNISGLVNNHRMII